MTGSGTNPVQGTGDIDECGLSSTYDEPLLNVLAQVEQEELEEDRQGIEHHYWTAKRKNCCLVVFFIGFVLSICIAIVAPMVLAGLKQNGIVDNVVISSEKVGGFKQFQNKSLTGDNYLHFYFFNITNPKGVLRGEKPNLKELGPWVYNAYQLRSDFDWDKENDTLAYREHSYYVFNVNETKRLSGFDSDNVYITTINMLFLGIPYTVGVTYWEMVCNFLGWKTDEQKLFTKRPVSEFLAGYEVEVEINLFVKTYKIPIKFPGMYPNLTKEEDPSYKSKLVMKVGEQDINQVYDLVSWHGMNELEILCPYGANPLPGGKSGCPSELPCCQKHSLVKDINNNVSVWGNTTYESLYDYNANLVHGRNGEQFQPNVKKGSHLVIFNDIVWRALLFRNMNDEQVTYKGIKMLRFSPVETLFMNASTYPPNERYYHFGPQGLLANLSILEQGSELFASLPHFLGADPELLEGVNGLKPERALHNMHIDVEPILGQTMVEHVRAQLVALISNGKRWGKNKWFKHLPDRTYVPVAWFDVMSTINQKGIDEFKILYLVDDISKGCRIFGSILAVICFAPLFYSFILCCCEGDTDDIEDGCQEEIENNS
uniref:Uncharacterized protein n=1 Tax=Mucochytrium quahogii TaxID=96639 RepID=A0A7S2RX12_9STRA|mmetsp:Transcript_35098/g.56194  ORF Transcript_35098/g.56194 Transcript_35098/m.56194 type:complete len:600 (-) Transcript_35098:22-1821(-)